MPTLTKLTPAPARCSRCGGSLYAEPDIYDSKAVDLKCLSCGRAVGAALAAKPEESTVNGPVPSESLAPSPTPAAPSPNGAAPSKARPKPEAKREPISARAALDDFADACSLYLQADAALKRLRTEIHQVEIQHVQATVEMRLTRERLDEALAALKAEDARMPGEGESSPPKPKRTWSRRPKTSSEVTAGEEASSE